MYRMNQKDLKSRTNDLKDDSVNSKKQQPKKSLTENGIDNPTFISDDSTNYDILDQTIEIVKELPHIQKSKS